MNRRLRAHDDICKPSASAKVLSIFFSDTERRICRISFRFVFTRFSWEYFDSHFCLCYRYFFSRKNSGEMKKRAEIQEKTKKAKLYTRFPLSSLLIYNGTTILHYLLGGAGIIVGYNFSVLSVIFGYLYFTFSFLKMYVVFPLTVCPNCVYYRLENSLCISGLNVVAKVLAKEGKPDDFPKRSKGLLSSNNLYMATLLIPLIAIIPALILNFSFLLLVLAKSPFIPISLRPLLSFSPR